MIILLIYLINIIMTKVNINSLVSKFIRENKILFIIYCICVLALPINEVILPHFYGKFIISLQNKTLVKKIIYIVIILLIIVQVMTFINDLIDIVLYPKMHRFVRQYSLDHIVKVKSTNLQEVEVGKIIAKLVRLPNLLYNYIEDWRNNIIPSFLIYIFVIIYFYTLDWVLSLCIFILAITIGLFTWKSFKSCTKYSQIRDQYHNKIFEEIDEILRNMVSMINNNNYEYEISRLDTLQESYNKYSVSTLLCTNKYKFMFMALFIIIVILFIIRCIYVYKSKKVNLAAFVSIFIIMLFLFNTTMTHTSSFKEIMIRYGTINEALELFNEPISIRDISNRILITDIPSDICLLISKVSYSHKNIKALSDISLAIKCNDNVAIIGEIGSGKSTLFKLIMKHAMIQDGEIYLNGIAYSDISEKDIRKKIGLIHQTSILFNRTLFDNIVYGNMDKSEDDVNILIDKLNLKEFIDHFPEKLQTMAGKYGSNLSGGEKQIIMILRLLLHNPDIILLDEPTSAMDSNTRDTIFSILVKLMDEKTIIAITHDEQLLKYFNRTITLNKGIIISDISKK